MPKAGISNVIDEIPSLLPMLKLVLTKGNISNDSNTGIRKLIPKKTMAISIKPYTDTKMKLKRKIFRMKRNIFMTE